MDNHLIQKQNHRTFKPFRYPWAFTAWQTQQRIHWLPDEVPLGDDVKDWASKLTESEKNLLTQIFRFFTQSDIEVQSAYVERYSPIYQPSEIQLMFAAFSSMETVHIVAYSTLLDTIGMPEIEYSAFLDYKEMKDKAEYLENIPDPENDIDRLFNIAVFSGFTEGLMLFSSFAILMNFPRLNKMKGMGQIVTWSIRDESLHVASMMQLFHEDLKQTNLSKEDYLILVSQVIEALENILEMEDRFIDLAFAQGEIPELTKEQVKQYIRYIAHRRLVQLKMETYSKYSQVTNPLLWLDEIVGGLEFANFFETRVTDYARAGTSGQWDEAFSLFADKEKWLVPIK